MYEKQDVRISVTIRKNGKPERWEPDALELYRRKENGFVCGELVVLEGKEAPEGSSGMEGIMEKIDYYIRKNPEKDLSLGYLAELFCFNSSYLSRAFHQYKGEALSSYIIRIRIERAKKLLLETDERRRRRFPGLLIYVRWLPSGKYSQVHRTASCHPR
ncbi:MAG: helix-turn-helix domain-containing protein [Lachnospiraceae bacterium]